MVWHGYQIINSSYDPTGCQLLLLFFIISVQLQKLVEYLVSTVVGFVVVAATDEF